MYRKIFLCLLTTIIIFATGSTKIKNIEEEIDKENQILISQEIIETDIKENLIYVKQEELKESIDESKSLEIIKETDEKSDKGNNKEDKTTKNQQKNNLGLSTNEKVEIETNYSDNKNVIQDTKKADNKTNNITVLNNKETKEDNSKNIESIKDNTSFKENTKKEFTYEQNLDQSNYMLSEFNRLTNNNSNFSAEVKELAKKGYSFYPYRESEIIKQIKNITFGDFYVYAEDMFLNGVYQRTIYYINFK